MNTNITVTREKREATLKARCALAGVAMYATYSDHGSRTYLLTRGPLTRELASLDAVEEWLNEAGVD